MSVNQYDGARDALQAAVDEFLQTATELRKQGHKLIPSPEVVGIAHAQSIIWHWVKPGDKSSEDRFRRRLHGQLDDLLQIAKERFGGTPVEVTDIVGVEDLRWHLYAGGPRAGFSGYLEKVGQYAPEGHERIVYWLAADGEILRPDRPGYPPGGEAPIAGS